MLDRVGTQVVTLGAEGVRIERAGEEPIVVRAVPEIAKVEPTGVGDAFRAGFLAALEWDLSLERAAQLGCLLAVYVVEQVGTQEYTLHQRRSCSGSPTAYGEEAAAEVARTCAPRALSSPGPTRSPSRSSTRSVAWPSSSPPYVARNAA